MSGHFHILAIFLLQQQIHHSYCSMLGRTHGQSDNVVDIKIPTPARNLIPVIQPVAWILTDWTTSSTLSSVLQYQHKAFLLQYHPSGIRNTINDTCKMYLYKYK
jgi:hypothetical protein